MIIQRKIETGEFTALYKSNNKSNIVLVCPGLGYSKSGPYFLLSNISRELHKHTNVMLFDYYGEGDSDGEYCDVSIEKIVSSGRNVLEYVKQIGYENIILLGLGIGNYVNLKLAEDKEVDSVVQIDYLEERIVNGIDFVGEVSEDTKRGLIGIICEERNNVITEDLISSLQKIYKQNNNITKEIICVNQVDVKNQIYNLSEIDISDKKLPFILDKIVDDVCSIIKEKSVKWDNELEEESIIQNNDNSEKTLEIENLQGVLHSGNNDTCIIYEPGLGGDRIDHMRTGVLLGVSLLKQGFDVFRYDFTGCGISEGEFHKYSWEERIHKLNSIIDRLKQEYGYKKIGIVSYSEGAKLVAYITDKREDIIGTVMMSPALYNGFYNYKGVEKQNSCKVLVPKFTNDIKHGICFPTQGFFLGMQYFTEQKKFDFYANYKNAVKDIFVIYGEEDTLFEREFFNAHSNSKFKLKGEGHLYTYNGTIKGINQVAEYFKRRIG